MRLSWQDQESNQVRAWQREAQSESADPSSAAVKRRVVPSCVALGISETKEPTSQSEFQKLSKPGTDPCDDAGCGALAPFLC